METILCEFPTFLHILGVKLLTGFVLDFLYALYIFLQQTAPACKSEKMSSFRMVERHAA